MPRCRRNGRCPEFQRLLGPARPTETVPPRSLVAIPEGTPEGPSPVAKEGVEATNGATHPLVGRIRITPKKEENPVRAAERDFPKGTKFH